MSHAVDVLIPTYKPNRAHLTEALTSLLSQEFQDWRAFIHDDFSTESVARSIVEPFLNDPRITFTTSKKRLGIGGNWNACIRQTSAPFIAFLFQDDIWTPEYLQHAIQILEQHPTVGFVSMEHAYRGEGAMTTLPLYEELSNFKQKNVPSGLHKGSEFLRFWIHHELHPNVIGEPSFVVLRRNAVNGAGSFLEDMPQFLDTEYWLRLLQVSDWYYLNDRSYGSFRVHPGGASAVNQEVGTGLYDRLRCFEYLIERLNGDDRSAAIEARNRAIETMIGKFFRRIGSGKKASAKGSHALLWFCLRHPMLIGRSILKQFFGRE